MDEYQQRRQALYDQITELLANSGLPWYQARSVLMQIKQDIYIAEGMRSSKEMVDVIRSARGNDLIEKKPSAATDGEDVEKISSLADRDDTQSFHPSEPLEQQCNQQRFRTVQLSDTAALHLHDTETDQHQYSQMRAQSVAAAIHKQ